MPWTEHPASAYASRRPIARFDPWADQPTTDTTATNANAVPLASRISPRRSSLTDTLSSLGARAPPPDVDQADTSLRRRRAMPQQAGPSAAAVGDDADEPFLERRRALDTFRYGNETVEERLAQHRASRMERLQALRRERHAMRTLLGGADGAASPSAEHGPLDAANPWAPPEPVRERTGTPPQARARSPGARGRGLGDFLRGLGGGTRYAFGGRGGLIGIWDDDLAGFFTRDSAALDPRNYLVRRPLLSLSGSPIPQPNPDARPRLCRTTKSSTRATRPSSACRSDSATPSPRASRPTSSRACASSSTRPGPSRPEPRRRLRPHPHRHPSRARARTRSTRRRHRRRRRRRSPGKGSTRRRGVASACATTRTTTTACSRCASTASTTSACGPG